MEQLINMANVLYLLSYFVRDMLKLRVLTVVAGTCLAVYFYLLPEPLMVAVYWNLAFVGINLARIALLVSSSNASRAQKRESKSSLVVSLERCSFREVVFLKRVSEYFANNQR